VNNAPRRLGQNAEEAYADGKAAPQGLPVKGKDRHFRREK
jgi:hypothetical protein